MVIFPLTFVLRGFYVCGVLNVRLDENPCAASINKKIPHLCKETYLFSKY
jgi:hypothetical protein